DRVVGRVGETEVPGEIAVEGRSRVDVLRVVPAGTSAGKPAVLLRIRLLFFAVGVADAIAGREASPGLVHPSIPQSSQYHLPVQNGCIVVAVPAGARVPEHFR